MGISIVFETHSVTEDNERGVVTGWEPGRLSDHGRVQARQLGKRRSDDGVVAVYSSDLTRAVETATLAFGGMGIPLHVDRRLRECHFGARTGSIRADIVKTRSKYIDEPYPGGESWRGAVERVGHFLADMRAWPKGSRLLVVGHLATWISFEHFLNGRDLKELLEGDRSWQPGWEYTMA